MKIETKIILPFQLPVCDGYKMISDYHFGQIYVNFTSLECKIDYDAGDIISNRSILNITCFPNESLCLIKEHDQLLRTFVLSIIGYINHFISAIRIEYQLSYLHHISVHDLPINLVIFIDGNAHLYCFFDRLYGSGIPNNIDIRKVLSTMTSMELYPNFYLAKEFYQSALSEVHKENFNRFIIDIETSFEMFIRNTLKLVMTKNGMPEEEIEKASTFPFRNVIEQHLAKYLNDCLSFDDNPVINGWYQNVYTPRNQLVHKGIRITNVIMVEKAIEDFNSAQKYINDLLIKNHYLDESGMVNLASFEGDGTTPIISSDIINKMKKEGLISQDLELAQINPYKESE